MRTPNSVGSRQRDGGPPARQRGIAMLVAIMLVALGTIIAAAVAYESAMSARRGTATFSFDEAILIGQGGEALAAYGLRAVVQNPASKSANGGVDIYPAQPWAQPVGPLEVAPGVTLEASLEDMQGRFNLNWLVATTGPNAGKADPDAVAAFTHLLELVQVDQRWADKVVDWIDANTNPEAEGAEDSAYLGQNPPYLTANMYITSASELLALPGFGRDRYAKLAPYITALPPGAGSTLNICSAPGPVLDAFIPGRQEWSGDPATLAKNRAGAPGCFPTKDGYKATFDAKDWERQAARFDTKSSYFRLTSLVTIGTSEFNLYSLLFMDNSGNYIHPIQRSFSAD